MTPQQLYDRKDFTLGEINMLFGSSFNHVQESGVESYVLPWDAQNERIWIRLLKDFCFDGRRIWRLGTVWLDGSPVMVFKNAGREGDDHVGRVITDEVKFFELCMVIREMAPLDITQTNDFHSADKEIPDLANFYGNYLDGDFEQY
jgi:hypothetical protein